MKLGALFIVFFIVTSCGVKIPENANIYNKDKRIGIIVVNDGIGAYTLSYSEHSPIEPTRVKKLEEPLKIIDKRLNAEQLFLQTYKTIYSKKGIELKKLKGNLTIEYLDFFKKPNSKKKYSKYNYGFIKEKFNIDQLIVVVVKYGLLYNKKTGFCYITTEMIDLGDNSLLLQNYSLGKIEVKGKWKTPPVYDNMYNAIRKAIENAILLEKIKFS